MHRPSFRSRLAMAFYCFTFGSFTWVWLFLLYVAYHRPAFVLPPIIAWLSYVLVVDDKARRTGWKPTCRNLPLWTRYMRSYFASTELSVHQELLENMNSASDRRAAHVAGGADEANDAADTQSTPSTPNMFLYHPHGILAIGSWLTFGCNALGLDDVLGGTPTRLVTLNINFFAPFLREFLLAHGVCSCAKKALVTLLQRKESVALVVGGGSESLLSKQGVYDLVLRRRRGFAKVALATGCNLVPAVGFGETDCYSTWNDWKIIQWIQKRIERKLGFTVPIAVGRGFFLPWGLLPHSCSLRVVIGKPVKVEKYEGPTAGKKYEGLVEDVKQRYERSLVEVFQKEGVKLRFVE